ncbi:MAG TPA: hypothetical protein VJB59_06930 [Bdellovibrionota bacterium]|nr:hypothetical protein [Bdellovibrionota bacterium]
MAKLKANPITAADLKKYSATYSDFAFEMRTLKQLNDLRFKCLHSGTYQDPVTLKTREFDIRAKKQIAERLHVFLSIECKNLQASYPLVVHSVKRRREEAFHQILCVPAKKRDVSIDTGIGISVLQNPLETIFDRTPFPIQFAHLQTPFSKEEWVGKSMDQVGIETNDELRTGDAVVFDKMSQAINSAYGLLEEVGDVSLAKEPQYFSVHPILVIPDGTLWSIQYDENGNTLGEPQTAAHISYYVHKEWNVGKGPSQFAFALSHIELVTSSGLLPLLKRYYLDEDDPPQMFGPTEELDAAFERHLEKDA